MVSVRKKAMDVFDIPDLMLLDVSHDGKFLLAVSNKENVHQVYQIPVDNPDKWKVVTSGEDRVLSGSLFKDDSRFLFPKAAGGSEKHDLYIYDFSTKKTAILNQLDSIRISDTKWTPDNFILYSGSSPKAIGLWKHDFADESISSLYQTNQLSGMGPVNPKRPLSHGWNTAKDPVHPHSSRRLITRWGKSLILCLHRALAMTILGCGMKPGKISFFQPTRPVSQP